VANKVPAIVTKTVGHISMPRILSLALNHWASLLGDKLGDKKTYHYAEEERGPFRVINRAITMVALILAALFIGFQLFAGVVISQSLEQQKEREAAVAEEARCNKNPWANGCDIR